VTGRTWVFGYGSLVSPTSLATTIGRVVAPGEVAVAELAGFGRRWNYGAMHVRGTWSHDGVAVTDGVMVALGLTAGDESCNGVMVAVDPGELANLDRRERDYDRTDVTDRMTVLDGVTGVATARPASVRIVTYVPRASAVERYQTARDAGRAAIRQDYWDLVDGAFAALGPDHLARYRATPPPDIPVVEMTITRT
jgi:cation transport regulator ChaC